MKAKSTHRSLGSVFLMGVCGVLLCRPEGRAQMGNRAHDRGIAWQILLKSRAWILPGATEQEKKMAADFNRGRDSLSEKILLNDRYLLRTTYGTHPYQVLLDVKDSVMTVKLNELVRKMDFAELYAQRDKDSLNGLWRMTLHPDSVKVLFGLRCHKATYQMRADTATHYSVWYTQDLPWTYFRSRPENQVPGIIMETFDIHDHLVTYTQASRVEQVPVTDSSFVLQSGNMQTSDRANEALPAKNGMPEPLQIYRDSLAEVLTGLKQKQSYLRGGIAKFCFVPVLEGGCQFLCGPV